MMPSTYDLLRAADAILAESWDMDPADADASLSAWIDAASDKAAALGAAHAMAAAHAETWRAEAARCTAARTRAEAVDTRVTAMMAALLIARRELGDDAKIPGVARLQRNGGRPPLIIAQPEPPADAPAELVRITRAWDTAAVRAVIEAGGTVAGVEVGERGEGVRWE